MKKAILLLLFTALLFGKESTLDDLLSEYREANELYLETKEEKSGHVILFSRADLDKMQAYTLNDVLKTLRMFTLKNTKFGMTSLVKSPYSESSMSSVRIFINNYEITSISAGTALTPLGKMGLNFIDHIEVYQASNSIALGGEVGNMIIKLYTKDPSRENASVLQTSIDSKSGSRTQLIEANSFKDYSYLANIDISNNEYDEYKSNASNLSRDGYRGQIYFNFSKKSDYTLEVGSSGERYSIFNGFGSAVTDGVIDNKYHYLQFTKYFDDSLKLTLSTTYETLKINNEDSTGITLFDDTTTNHLSVKTGSYTNSIGLEKKYRYQNNNFLLGTQIKQKTFFLDELKSQGVQKEITLGPKDVDIYMLYMQDAYDINENHQITVGAKLNYYKDTLNKSSLEEIYRLAYVGYISEYLSIKSFIQKTFNYPIYAQTTFSPVYIPNPNLNSSKGLVAKIETEYKKDDLTLTLITGASKPENGIVYNPAKKMYVNNNKSSDFWQFCLNVNYKLNPENKFIIEYFKAYKDNASLSSDTGVLVQLYNKIDKFDMYNELIYRSSYKGADGVEIDAGYDYTAGVIYHYDKKLDLKLKAENIFDKAIKTSIGGITMPSIEKKVIFTMEYIF